MRQRDDGNDDSLPVMVPRSDKGLAAIAPERVRQLREHLIKALRDLRTAYRTIQCTTPSGCSDTPSSTVPALAAISAARSRSASSRTSSVSRLLSSVYTRWTSAASFGSKYGETLSASTSPASVCPSLDPSAFTVRTVPKRLKLLKVDPWTGFAETDHQRLPDLAHPRPPRQAVSERIAPATASGGTKSSIVFAAKPKRRA
jgi:hypothetical protein